MKRFYKWSKKQMEGGFKTKAITIFGPAFFSGIFLLLSGMAVSLLKSDFADRAFIAVVHATIMADIIWVVYFIVVDDIVMWKKLSKKREREDKKEESC